jgi:uncharacterized protein YecE (DUF72 family)
VVENGPVGGPDGANGARPTPGLPFRLGLPAWAHPSWRGRWLDPRQPALASYARVLNAVEGNTTFYRVPEPGTVAAWRDAVRGRDFRFCFKLPREVTHRPHPDLHVLDAFLAALEPLRPWLGPLLVQFPAEVGPDALNRVQAVLAHLPQPFERVVEVRHPDLFARPDELEALLASNGSGLACLDARAIHHTDPSHPEVAAARHEKPDLPVRAVARHGCAFVRLVLHPDERWNAPYLDAWVAHCAAWLSAGVAVWMMIHCPENRHCPAQAEQFHERLRVVVGPERLPSLPPWPVPRQGALL